MVCFVFLDATVCKSIKLIANDSTMRWCPYKVDLHLWGTKTVYLLPSVVYHQISVEKILGGIACSAFILSDAMMLPVFSLTSVGAAAYLQKLSLSRRSAVSCLNRGLEGVKTAKKVRMEEGE